MNNAEYYNYQIGKIENTIFEPVNYKTAVKGYWKDEKGKLFKDNINLYNPVQPLDIDNKLADLFFKGEKCVFIRGISKSFVIYPNNKQIVLSTYIQIKKDKGTLTKSFIKELLAKHQGFTVYKYDKYYLFEIWSA